MPPHVRSAELVASALRDSDAGMPDADNAAKHGVAIKTIRRWRRLYQRRGQARGQAHTSVPPCPPQCDGATLDTPPAYAELLGWYLGDGHITRGRRNVYNLHVVNDEKYTADNIGIAALMAAVKPGGRPHTRRAPGCIITTVGWRHWPCLFPPQHGPGRKHDRPIVLDDWQRAIVEDHPGPFLRGLFHSDGCRVDNWTRRIVAGAPKVYRYPRWQFCNASRDIRELCCWALDLVEIPWRQSNVRIISVSRREAVERSMR